MPVAVVAAKDTERSHGDVPTSRVSHDARRAAKSETSSRSATVTSRVTHDARRAGKCDVLNHTVIRSITEAGCRIGVARRSPALEPAHGLLL